MDIRLIILGILGIGIKLLLIPGYYSTDFDVHHNWLRITYTKPLSQWYYDNQSKWTLDYPPFFAYFQYILALIANYIDSNIMTLQVTKSVLYFQRLTVIITQIPFLYVLYLIYNKQINQYLVISYLFIPLIILDNIHFQYNIMLQTIFLYSVYNLIIKQNYLIAALTYSILLNFKHIYLYSSIAFFIIILKNYVLNNTNHVLNNKNHVLNNKNNHNISLRYLNNHNQNQQNNSLLSQSEQPKLQQLNNQKFIRLIKVGLITILPFIISFGPFIMSGGMQYMRQIVSRLFPFGRGLIHDYWAPNIWGIYYFTDKILSFVLRIVFGYEKIINIQQISVKSSMDNNNKGLNNLKILPQVSANITLLIIIICLIPLIMKQIKRIRIIDRLNMIRIIIINGIIFFMFGYHVHQKAISPYLHLLFTFITAYLNNKVQINKIKNKQVINNKQQINSKQVINNNKKVIIRKQIKYNKRNQRNNINNNYNRLSSQQQQCRQQQQSLQKQQMQIKVQYVQQDQQLLLISGIDINIIQILIIIFINIINLYPLLIDIQQKPLKIIITLIYYQIVNKYIQSYQHNYYYTKNITNNKFININNKNNNNNTNKNNNINNNNKMNNDMNSSDNKNNNNIIKDIKYYKYLLNICMLLVVLCQIIIPYFNWINNNKLQFLPLMINSVTSALINLIWITKVYYQHLNQ